MLIRVELDYGFLCRFLHLDNVVKLNALLPILRSPGHLIKFPQNLLDNQPRLLESFALDSMEDITVRGFDVAAWYLQ